MSPADQLDMRALRMVMDGKAHSAAAMRWARARLQMAMVPVDGMKGFTARELSLGAGEVYA